MVEDMFVAAINESCRNTSRRLWRAAEWERDGTWVCYRLRRVVTSVKYFIPTHFTGYANIRQSIVNNKVVYHYASQAC